MPCYLFLFHFRCSAYYLLLNWKENEKKKKHCSDAPNMKTKLVVSHLVFRLHHSSSDNANDFATVTKWSEAVLDSHRWGKKN